MKIESTPNNINDVILENTPASTSEIIEEYKSTFDALELYNLEIETLPKLLDPFFQKVGLASLVGTSDSGKSTFLRQLSLSVVLQKETFIGCKLNCKSNKVIYVSTEDDSNSVSAAIRKQIQYLQIEDPNLDFSLLKNLQFIFDTENLLERLKKILEKEPCDLIVIDAFTDVFAKEINANTQVRQFLNEYDKLAKKYGCLILFLHHIGKNTQKNSPSKDSIIGSQAFEAKMRSVIELRPNHFKDNYKDLWVLKANFLDSSHKSKSYVLEMNKNLIFRETGERNSKIQNSKKDNTVIIDKVLELKNKGLSVRQIEAKLKDTEFRVSKSVISEIINKNKK
ncbi:AAA family ATPase [Flavobacterium nitratireducens]|uniref:AAA family ATPase n=1 Tax=Flavobacterium nitratireducens TaxID=992289 RepID=UPI0024156E63|nr:AAA family ATPase [Flavobacterium nitratireducens]